MQPTEQLLIIGNSCQEICQEMAAFNYTGIPLSSVSDAEKWRKNRAKTGKSMPDVILCESFLEDGNALDVYTALFGGKVSHTSVFILVTSVEDTAFQYKAYKKGIDDCILLPATGSEINGRIQHIRKFKLTDPSSVSHQAAADNVAWMLFKRCFDIMIAASALILLMPLLLLIALLIKLDSKGPVIYVSKRAGKNYKVFDFYKFRSMHVDADKQIHTLAALNIYQQDSSFIKIKDDPRVTKFGSFLRSCSLDELPQLVNVLKGDMSMIGNRPLPLYEAQQLTTDEWALRFLAPAGMTGLWQVSKKDQDILDDRKRKQLDARYAIRQSLKMDYEIFLKTFAALRQCV